MKILTCTHRSKQPQHPHNNTPNKQTPDKQTNDTKQDKIMKSREK